MARFFVFLFILAAVIALTDPAFAAASADWVKPATDMAKSLESGMVKIGAVLVGIGIIFVGLAAALIGHLHWDKFGYVLLGGILIMAGPAALRSLLSSAGP